MSDSYRPAALDPDALETLRALEQDLGKVVVALSEQPQLAELDEAQLTRVREAESRLGVVIVAYD